MLQCFFFFSDCRCHSCGFWSFAFTKWPDKHRFKHFHRNGDLNQRRYTLKLGLWVESFFFQMLPLGVITVSRPPSLPHLSSSSFFNILWPICLPSVLCTSPNCLNLTSPAVPLMYSFLIPSILVTPKENLSTFSSASFLQTKTSEQVSLVVLVGTS